MADIAYVSQLPKCDFCKEEGEDVDATHDVKTIHGPWASVCGSHRTLYANTMALGTGLGQQYVVGEPPVVTPEERRAKVDEALRSGSYEDLMDAVGDGDIAEWL